MTNLISDFDGRLDRLCKIGQGKHACRWLARGRHGLFCAKLDPVWSEDIRKAFEAGTMGAQGDNCPGLVPQTTWPISRCRGKHLDTWEFVEEVQGSYESAMRRAAELQGSRDAEWQYRIWDCRDSSEKSPPGESP